MLNFIALLGRSICNQEQSILIFVIFRQNTKVIALLRSYFLICNPIFNFCHFSAKYQGYSLTIWPKIAQSLFNLQSKSIIFRQNTKVIALLLAKIRSFSSLFNLQSINQFNFGHFSAKYQGYSLTFWPKIAHFHCNSSINFQFWSFYQGYSLTANHFHHLSICNQCQFLSFFGKIPRL